LFLLSLVLLGSGCQSVPHPGAYVEHQPGDGSKTCPVPYTETYILSGLDPTIGELIPLERVTIEEESQVGFVRQPTGEFIAYAGGRRFPLLDGYYVWQITPETQKTRTDVRQGDVGKVLHAAGKVLGQVGVVTLEIAGKMLYGFAATGGHN
jgi:hypothetical protein